MSIQEKFTRARKLRDAGRFREAIQQYELCISNSETTSEIRCLSFHEIALCYTGMKFSEIALDYYELAIQISQTNKNTLIENAALRDMAMTLLQSRNVSKDSVLQIINRSIVISPDENSRIKSEIFRERILDKFAEPSETYEEKAARLDKTIDLLYESTKKESIKKDRYFLKKVYEYLSDFADKRAQAEEEATEKDEAKSFIVDKRKRLIRVFKKWLRKVLKL